MSLDNEILRYWRGFCDDLARESQSLSEFFALLQRREEFARLSSAEWCAIRRNPDLMDDDPWQTLARHSLCRLYLGRTSHYVLTCVSQPIDDDARPDVAEVLTDLAVSALHADRAHKIKDGAEMYLVPIPGRLREGDFTEDRLFWKPLRLPLLVAKRFQDRLGRSRWEIMARRLKQLRQTPPTGLVHSREWWQAQYRRLNSSSL